VNVLFVNYGDFTTNSLNHIAGFAAALRASGHDCIVAVPARKETLAAVPNPQFAAATYAEVLAHPARFANGHPADVLHAWTPREGVRKFVLAHQRLHPARLVIHLEDNEEHLLAAFAGQPLAELRALADDELAARLEDSLPHPVRHRNFLRVADGITIISPRLQEFVPGGIPVQLLPPGVDFALYRPRPADPALRRELGLRDGERIITFTGSTTFANAADMQELVAAVRLLNDRGVPTRLVRTGFHPDEFTALYTFDWRACTLDLGFVPKARLPALLALADVLVQPGHPGAFNDYRLPSKLPEFLAAGRPVILPAANIAALLRDGTDALVMKTGSPPEIADLCQRVCADPALAARLGENAAAFARKHFDLTANTAALAAFYQKVTAAPARAGWAGLAEHASETALLPALLHQDPAALADLALAIAHTEQQLGRGPAKQLVDRLEAEVQRLRTLNEFTEKHATNLELQLKWAKDGIAKLNEVRRQARLYQTELIQTIAGNADERAKLNAQIATLHYKIRRREESFSWQVTAPLRLLRRLLLDPFRSPGDQSGQTATGQPAAAVLPTPPALDRDFQFQVDEPAFWHVPSGPLAITGWSLGPDRKPVRGIRARLGDRTVNGSAGLVRPDVASRHNFEPAAHSGFELNVTLPPGTHALRIEVLGAGDEWHLVAAPTVTAFAHSLPVTGTYAQWIDLYDRMNPARLLDYRERLAALPRRPLISILLPVYNVPERWLARALASVRGQLYENWELCIADDTSTAAHVRPLLEQAAREDARIKVVFRPANGHISAASNSALDLATGEFTALLDHDDELAPHALAEVALALAAQPRADLIYSDEDKIDEEGRRFAPYFKPDFLPDLFLGQNYLTHLAVYRTELMRRAGGFRAGYEGSQDWDLALRVIELTDPARIVHLPKILYHWRAIAGSTALTLDQKQYHIEAARKALADHLARTGRRAELVAVPGGHWRVQPPLPPEPPLVSIIIPTRNGLEHLRRCVGSLRSKTTYPRYEIIIVDNGSDDPATLAWLREAAATGVRVLTWSHPFKYSAINNFAAREARGDLLALLNNDLEVITPGWLEEMAAQALRPEIGAVGAMLYYPDDRIQHAGAVLGIGGVAGHAFKLFPRGTDGSFNRARLVQNYSAVTAACLVIRKELFNRVGGFDEKSLAVAFNDIDFCLKVRATGVRNLWTPFAEFYHHESATRGTEDTPEKQARFQREVETMLARWGDALRADPAYNPNLSLESEDFALAFPPRPAPGSSRAT
jgi:GT2 family glycosyltransferase/glycosyltransferase involved in cell wall biosynthesis